MTSLAKEETAARLLAASRRYPTAVRAEIEAAAAGMRSGRSPIIHQPAAVDAIHAAGGVVKTRDDGRSWEVLI